MQGSRQQQMPSPAGVPQQQQQQLNMRFLSQFLNPNNSELLQHQQQVGAGAGSSGAASGIGTPGATNVSTAATVAAAAQIAAVQQQQQQQQQKQHVPLSMMMSPQIHNRTIQQQVLAASLQQGQAGQAGQAQPQQQVQAQQQLLQQVQQQQAAQAAQAALAAQRITQAQAQAQQQQQQQPMVREVWKDNLESEMMVLRVLAERYNHISVSTEFAGIVARPIGSFRSTRDYHYQTVRSNADLLNLIQVGITLSDKDGKRPEGVPSTWQFNFRFDLENEMFSRESIESLVTTGLNFNRMKEYGIDVFEFSQVLIDSGLCLLKDTTWISYHAGYDFGFLISLLINRKMPINEDDFESWLTAYFPNYYDIKYISVSKIFGNSQYKNRSLETLAEELGVIRNVNLNLLQVGGQSMLTHLCFWELKRLLGEQSLETLRNQIWGLSDDNQRAGAPQTTNNSTTTTTTTQFTSPPGISPDQQKNVASPAVYYNR